MKRGLAAILIMVICAAVAGEAGAISVGVPGRPVLQGRVVSGLEYSSIKDRDLGDPLLGPNKLKTDSRQFFGKLTYGLTDRVTIFGKLGVADLQLWDENQQVLYDHGGDLAYGAGLKVKFYEDLSLGLTLWAGGQYFAFDPSDANGGRSASWVEYQGELGLSLTKTIIEAESLVEPFLLTHTGFHAGLKFSDVNVDWTTPSLGGTMEAMDSVGFFTGFDVLFNDLFLISAELRAGDEMAMAAGLGFLF